jgi:hypothetical protein
MILYTDGTAEIVRARGNLESVINEKHNDYDKETHIKLGYYGIEQAVINKD